MLGLHLILIYKVVYIIMIYLIQKGLPIEKAFDIMETKSAEKTVIYEWGLL